ncbi:unnamed protein product [Linum trigynum]|uniref:Uncharacterized protein n=1 Tax=Linum trigynum TaxID=586398 RepID=A0AAV2E9R2_9ROSI
MNVPAFINVLGWSDILVNQDFGQYPEVVHMFYANMKSYFNTIPPSFITIVFNYLITINVELLSLLLGIPINGAEFMDASLTSKAWNSMNSRLFASILAILEDTIRMCFLQEDFLMISKFSTSISLRPFFLDLMASPLFIPQTCGLWKVTFPLPLKLLASVRRRRPRVDALGGHKAGNVVPSLEECLSIVVLVGDVNDKGNHALVKEVGASSRDIMKESANNENLDDINKDEDISDYMPSPIHPF